MKKVQSWLLPLALSFPLVAAPHTALAFATVDTLPWPSRGIFPAYERDEVRPTTFWAQGGLMRDDNLLRRETGGRSDTISRVGAGLRYDQRIIGRQRLRLDARADYYNFQEFGELDHLAYSLNGAWNWEVGNNLAGSVFVGRDRRLMDLSELAAAERDLATSTRIGATGGVLVTPRFRVRGGISSARAERRIREDADTRAIAWTAGAEYVSPLRNTLGVEYRRSDGEAPQRELITPLGTFVNNDFTEQEIAFVAGYSPGPQLRTEWRLGRTQREYEEIPGRDFSGTTYGVHVEWLPGNKTILAFDAYREPRSILDVGASHVLVTGLGFGPSWAATNKLVFSLRLLREQRKFEGDPNLALLGGFLRDEVVYTTRFGIGWEFARHWEASFALDVGERESNFAGRDYKYTAGMVNVAWRY